jgi:hypothetical protein
MIHVAALLGDYMRLVGLLLLLCLKMAASRFPVSSLPQLFGEMRHDGAYPPSNRIGQIVMGVTALKRRLEADCVRVTHAHTQRKAISRSGSLGRLIAC